MSATPDPRIYCACSRKLCWPDDCFNCPTFPMPPEGERQYPMDGPVGQFVRELGAADTEYRKREQGR